MAKTGIKNVNYNLLDSENQSDLGVLYDCAPILVVFQPLLDSVARTCDT